jgi:large subunit ribosomal protein L4
MKVPVLSMAGTEVDTVELPAEIFEVPVKVGLMHQAYVRQMANARQGTHKTKTRSEVQRSKSKWYRQKGTGRARHGSRNAPIFVGGGVAHGPKPRKYTKKMPKKMRRAALRSLLSAKAAEAEILVVDRLALDAPSTREMAETLDALVGDKSAVVLLAERNEPVEKSVRNITGARTLRVGYLNVRDVLGHEMLIMPLDALEHIKGWLGTNQEG